MKHSIWVKIMVWVLVVLMAGSCAHCNYWSARLNRRPKHPTTSLPDLCTAAT